MTRFAILMDIVEERKRQDLKWGKLPRIDHNFGKWLQILMEEIGEASKADLEVQASPRHGGEDERFTQQYVEQVNKELTQAAAVLVAWIEHRSLE